MRRLTRVYAFSASHRLHSDQLSAEKNATLYGKCNHPFGHGHNYKLHVSVKGPVQDTGRVIDLGAFDRYVQDRVISAVNQRDLNCDVPDFRGLVPTTENLAHVIRRRLSETWPESFHPAQLDRIYIEETPRNTFELRVR